MKYAILDCYTDEAAGLGVPPYLGTYPRYIAGYLNQDVYYLTIDDLRLYQKHDSKIKPTRLSEKTDSTTYNLTINYRNIKNILKENIWNGKVNFSARVQIKFKYVLEGAMLAGGSVAAYYYF